MIHDNCLKFDVMSTCFKVCVEENDKLKDQLSNKRRQLDQMRERTENLQAEKDKSERLLNQLGADIETMCAKHAEEKAALSAAQQSHVDALMLTQSEKLEKLTKKHMKEIQSLDESHKAEITKLNEDHATHVVELENAKVQEQALIKSQSQEEISRLQTKIKQLEVSTLLDNQVSGLDPQTNLIKELKK